jgi:hypothetical protein
MDQHQKNHLEGLDILVIAKDMPSHWETITQVLEIKAWEKLDVLLLDQALDTHTLPKQILCTIFMVPISMIDPEKLALISQRTAFIIHDHHAQLSGQSMLKNELSAISFAHFIDRQLSSYLEFFPQFDPRHDYFFEQLACGLNDLIQMVIYENMKQEHPYHALEKFCNLLAYIQEYINEFYSLKYFNITSFLYQKSVNQISSYLSEAFWEKITLDYWYYVKAMLNTVNELDQNQQKEKLAKKYHQEFHGILLSRHLARAKIMIDHHIEQLKYARMQDQKQLSAELLILLLNHTQAIEELKEYAQANQLYLHTLQSLSLLSIFDDHKQEEITQQIDDYRFAQEMNQFQSNKAQNKQYEQIKNLEFHQLCQQLKEEYYQKTMAN